MKVIKYFLPLLISFIFQIAFGNIPKVDSLYNELKNANDSVKFAIYDELYSVLKTKNADSAMALLDEAIKFAERKNNTWKIGTYRNFYGFHYEHSGQIEKAIYQFEESYKLFLKIDSLKSAATSLNNLGAMFNNAGRYNDASKNLFQALNLAEENEFVHLTATINNNLGLLFLYQDEWEKSIEYFNKSIKINRQLNNLSSMALLHNNIGIAYYYIGILDSVLISFERSLNIYIQLNDKKGQTRPLFNIGEIYAEKGDYTKALEYYERSLKLEKEIGYISGYATSLVFIGEVYANQKDYSKALKYQHEGINILKKLDMPIDLLDAYNALSGTYADRGNYDSALFYKNISIELKDSLFSLDKSKQIAELETIYETEKKEQQIALQQLEIENKNKQTLSLSIILALAVVLILYVILANRRKRKTNLDLQEKNQLLKLQNQKITNSITYASLIQNTILPPVNQFENTFPESFIFFKPKDIVSGDFYWITSVKDKIIVALADCTGHGVPGAFMSMLGMTFLKETIDIKGITDPHIILNQLRDNVIEALRQKDNVKNTLDGMDMTICSIDTKSKILEYSGALLPMMLFTNGKLIEFKPNRMPIGYHKTRKGSFTSSSYSYESGDTLYFYTDGFADQFGGDEKKKYSVQKFKKLINDIHQLPLEDQKWVFEKELNLWKGNKEQVDDITIMGIKL